MNSYHWTRPPMVSEGLSAADNSWQARFFRIYYRHFIIFVGRNPDLGLRLFRLLFGVMLPPYPIDSSFARPAFGGNALNSFACIEFSAEFENLRAHCFFLLGFDLARRTSRRVRHLLHFLLH